MALVREIQTEDAEAASAILCAYITQLCTADHHRNAELIKGWLANKTPEHLLQWLAQPTSRLLVALVRDDVAGVGGFDLAGNVTLNYVAPDHRFKGVSKALLAAMESQLRQSGVTLARLDSTETAHSFYDNEGWCDAGEPNVWMGLVGYPMEKALG